MIRFEFDSRQIEALKAGRITPAIARALRKAGATALRDMRSEASKRIRQRKKIKAKVVRDSLVMGRPNKVTTIDGQEWALKVRGGAVSLVAYPHRQTKKGVVVEVNRGKRTLIKSAFLATMANGHRGVFVRRGAKRVPIGELLGSRPVDALLHEGEAEGVQLRGQRAFAATFERVLPLELDRVTPHHPLGPSR